MVYVTERCVLELIDGVVTVTEIAPGVDLQRDVLDKAGYPLAVHPELRLMDPAIFRDEPMGLTLKPARRVLDIPQG